MVPDSTCNQADAYGHSLGAGIATFVLESPTDLHAALDRVYRLAVRLPEVPIERFRTATRGLPKATEAERHIFHDALMTLWGGFCPLTASPTRAAPSLAHRAMGRLRRGAASRHQHWPAPLRPLGCRLRQGPRQLHL